MARYEFISIERRRGEKEMTKKEKGEKNSSLLPEASRFIIIIIIIVIGSKYDIKKKGDESKSNLFLIKDNRSSLTKKSRTEEPYQKFSQNAILHLQRTFKTRMCLTHGK